MSEKETSYSIISRRQFLGITAAGIVGARHTEGQFLGELADYVLSPNTIVPYTIPVLIPRTNDEPVVKKHELQEVANTINPRFLQQDDSVKMVLPSTYNLLEEHSDSQVRTGLFLEAGTGIITTAEGLIEGKQEYCQFFRNEDNQLLAVGYESGLYSYNNTLREWVRTLIIDNQGNKYVAKSSESTWDELEKSKPSRMIFEDIAAGTKTLATTAYRPWAAVLATTKIPKGVQIETSLENYAHTSEEVVISGENLYITPNVKRYFVTQNGDIVDIAHVWAKSSETLDLFFQLYKQVLTRNPSPTARIEYDVGKPARFEFTVSHLSLRPQTILDTTFQIMEQVTYLMEGIVQRYAEEHIPLADRVVAPTKTGMTPEDMFSNSLAIVGMLSLVKSNFQEITRMIATRKDLSSLKNLLMRQTIKDIVARYGVRQNPQIENNIALLGVYPLIPSKVSKFDTTPTHIDLNGLNPNNPRVHCKATHVPAVEANLERLVAQFDGAVNSFFDKLNTVKA